ncbi:hypothetical protein F5X97DRAFT_325026 [Nemania serpens]|nr:hypothetical protein F5X97DRAFT_325026 [Nemania serpens]
MRELWNVPAEGSQWLVDAEVDEALVGDDLIRWKNQNSFVARLTITSFCPGLVFRISQLKAVLEEPAAQGPIQECRLWVACEWIIRCADVIYQAMITEKNPDVAFNTGSLCGNDIPHFGIDRWEFWKKRFGEISEGAKDLKLDITIDERIPNTIKSMGEV